MALGAVVDGCPAGIPWDQALLETWTLRRRPGQAGTTTRQESDSVEILSGVYEGKTLGTPIAMMVRNRDARSQAYRDLPHRQGHADDLWPEKFGHADPRGGGRASGRETVARVMAGAVAQMWVRSQSPETQVVGRLTRVGELHGVSLETELAAYLARAAETGESFGAELAIECVGGRRGLGQPVFHKLKADLAAAWMGVGAVNAVEFGEGFSASGARGTEFHVGGRATQYGGVRGGISTGEPIMARVSIKPTSSIRAVAQGGRHDPCVGIRALPVLEAMTWLVLADHELWRRLDRA